MTKIEIRTKDDYILRGRYFTASEAKAVVMFNPGTATKSEFYYPFAEYLASQGYHVFVWNYRGFSESKNGSLKNSPIRYSDIGYFDVPAVIERLRSDYPDLPLYAIGHSAGGQQIGFPENHKRLDGIIAIGVSGGYPPYMPMSYRPKPEFLFRVFVPLSHLLFGYVRTKKFDLMEDLPTHFAKEWGDWCYEKNYFFSNKYYGVTIPEGTYKDLKIPVHVLVADDEEISTRKNVEGFWSHVSSEKGVHIKTYKAADFPRKEIGHFGYFRKVNSKIWEDVVGILRELKGNS